MLVLLADPHNIYGVGYVIQDPTFVVHFQTVLQMRIAYTKVDPQGVSSTT